MSTRVVWLGAVDCFAECGWKPGQPDPGGTKSLCVKQCLDSNLQQQWPQPQAVQQASQQATPAQTPTFPTVPDPGCLTDCENKWGISGGNWNAAELAKCVAACSEKAPTAPTIPLPPGGAVPGGGGVSPSSGGGSSPSSGSSSTPSGGGNTATKPASEEKTPWGWIALGGLALVGAVWAVARGAGQVGGAMAENPGRRFYIRQTRHGYSAVLVDGRGNSVNVINGGPRDSEGVVRQAAQKHWPGVKEVGAGRWASPASNPREWWGPGQRWLEQEALKEYRVQLAAHQKRGRAKSTFRYTLPDWHRDAVDALGRNDEERFKAIKLDRIGYPSR